MSVDRTPRYVATSCPLCVRCRRRLALTESGWKPVAWCIYGGPFTGFEIVIDSPPWPCVNPERSTLPRSKD